MDLPVQYCILHCRHGHPLVSIHPSSMYWLAYLHAYLLTYWLTGWLTSFLPSFLPSLLTYLLTYLLTFQLYGMRGIYQTNSYGGISFLSRINLALTSFSSPSRHSVASWFSRLGMTSVGIEPQATQYTFDIQKGEPVFQFNPGSGSQSDWYQQYLKHQKPKTRTIHVQIMPKWQTIVTPCIQI